MKIIEIQLDDAMAEKIEAFLVTATKPPRKEGQSVIIDRIWNSVDEWVADLLTANLQNIAAANPTPEMQAIEAEIRERQERLKQLHRPVVKVK